MNTPNRVIAYIDGFNFYHAIDELKKPHLKWVNLWSVADSLLRSNQKLQAVKYYSAYARWIPGAYHRHIAYVRALEANGVTTVMSEFKERRVSCKRCGAMWKTHEEKETDVFLAVDIVDDLRSNNFDLAILITADTDIRPAVNKIRATPGRGVLVATPPKRFGRARSLSPNLEVTQGRISKNLLPETITGAGGTVIATRPVEYAPPP